MSKLIIINLEVINSVMACPHRGMVKLFIYYKGGKDNYI